MKVKEENEKASLKLNIQKTKIMASGPLTSQQTEGEKVEAVADFLFLGSKITADSDNSHGIQRCLLLGRKALTKLDSVLKSRAVQLHPKSGRKGCGVVLLPQWIQEAEGAVRSSLASLPIQPGWPLQRVGRN